MFKPARCSRPFAALAMTGLGLSLLAAPAHAEKRTLVLSAQVDF